MDDLEDVRILTGLAERKGVQLSELLAEGNLLLFGEMLIAEEDHLSLQKRVTHELNLIGRQGVLQIDIVQHRTEGNPKVLELDAMSVGSLSKLAGDGPVAHTLVFQGNPQTRPVPPREEPFRGTFLHVSPPPSLRPGRVKPLREFHRGAVVAVVLAHGVGICHASHLLLRRKHTSISGCPATCAIAAEGLAQPHLTAQESAV